MRPTSVRVDLTEGPLIKKVLLFALPICLSNVLQQLYNTVDTLIIGNYSAGGTVSQAAVATSGQPVEILLSLLVGIGNGVSILTAQSAGRKDPERIRTVAKTACSLVYYCSLPLMLIGFLLSGPVLQWMNVPQDTFSPARLYLCLSLLGVLATLGYNTNAGLLMGMGDSGASLRFLTVSCVVNIVLDYLLVAVIPLEVTGAAVATVAAQYISWLMSVMYIRSHYPDLFSSLRPGKCEKSVLRDIVRIGVPVGINNSLYSMGHLVVQAMINSQGAVFMSACSVSGKVTGLVGTLVRSLSVSATTFSGQNRGAGKISRLKSGVWRLTLYAAVFSITLSLTVCLLSEPLMRLFTRDEAVIPLAVRCIWLFSPFAWMYAALNTLEYFINGLGEVRWPTVVSLIMLWGVRIPSAWVIARYFDGSYINLCYAFSFFTGLAGMLLFFTTKKWKRCIRNADAEEHGGADG